MIMSLDLDPCSSAVYTVSMTTSILPSSGEITTNPPNQALAKGHLLLLCRRIPDRD